MTKAEYQEACKIVNDMLNFGKAEVVDTSNIDPKYCDKWSIRLDDDAYDMYWQYADRDAIDDAIHAKMDGAYIEPYNRTLLNLAR